MTPNNIGAAEAVAEAKPALEAAKAESARKPTAKARPARKQSGRQRMTLAKSAKASVEDRVAALAGLAVEVCKSEEKLESVLGLLRDANEPLEVRIAALQAVQAASFSVLTFEPCRGAWLAALRQVAADPDPEIRQSALGILMRERDGFAQKKLLEGLRKKEKALLPPEKALQLLSYDVHSDAYPVAREIVADPPNPAARREALRLLAADADSAPLFAKILRDKDELAEARQISAAALQSLRPDALQQHAREIVIDASDYPEIHATSLTALTQFGDEEAVMADDSLMKRVATMSGGASAKVKQSAKRFLGKYGR
jgi:hypothetical protein